MFGWKHFENARFWVLEKTNDNTLKNEWDSSEIKIALIYAVTSWKILEKSVFL